MGTTALSRILPFSCKHLNVYPLVHALCFHTGVRNTSCLAVHIPSYQRKHTLQAARPLSRASLGYSGDCNVVFAFMLNLTSRLTVDPHCTNAPSGNIVNTYRQHGYPIGRDKTIPGLFMLPYIRVTHLLEWQKTFIQEQPLNLTPSSPIIIVSLRIPYYVSRLTAAS